MKTPLELLQTSGYLIEAGAECGSLSETKKTQNVPLSCQQLVCLVVFCDGEWELLLHRGEGRNLRENILQTQHSHFLLQLQGSIVSAFCSHYLSSCHHYILLPMKSQEWLYLVFSGKNSLFLNSLHQQNNS